MTTLCQVPSCGRPTDAFLCPDCGAELRAALDALPGLMHEVSILATGQARVYRRNGAPVPTEDLIAWNAERDELPPWLRAPVDTMTLIATRAMVNLAGRAKLDEAWNTLTTWTRHLIEHRGARNPFGPRPAGPTCADCSHDSCAEIRELTRPTNPAAVASWLADRINAVRYDEAGPDMHAELTALRRHLAHLVDRAPSYVYAGPCHATLLDTGQRCDQALYAAFSPWAKRDDRAQPDERVIACDGFRPANLHDDPNDPTPTGTGCGAEHTIEDRTEWLIAELHDQLRTLDFWQRWLPQLLPSLAWPSRSTWWRWRETRRLEAKTITPDAEELFRGGDLIELVEREQARIRGNQDRARAQSRRAG